METLVINGKKQDVDITADSLKKATKLTINTGNIANWNSLKSRKITQNPSTELYHSLSKTIQELVNPDAKPQKPPTSEDCFAEGKDTKPLRKEEERGLVKVTGKIFLHKFNKEYIKEAVDYALSELGIDYLDTIYLALPPLDDSQSFSETMKPFWEEMERLHEAKITTHISSCDLDQTKLEILVNMAKIHPEVNQVNLTSCCHMPEDLVAYAKEINILLHTHGDHPVMLPDENIEKFMLEVNPNDKRAWSANWVVRYAVVVKCRGVIKSKGYIASIESSGAEGQKSHQALSEPT